MLLGNIPHLYRKHMHGRLRQCFGRLPERRLAPREISRECDGGHLALGLDAPHESQMKRKASKRRAGTTTMRGISIYMIDMVAVAAAAILAVPFFVVMISPFLGGL